MSEELDLFRQQWLDEIDHRRDQQPSNDQAPVEVVKKSEFQAQRPDAAYHNKELSEMDLLALEKFEDAIDMEHNGSFGDAVASYRDAYKINEKVDMLFREKYYSPQAKIIQESKKQELQAIKLEADIKTLSISEDVGDDVSFISEMPSEIIVRIMELLILDDVNSFVRMLQVNSRFANIGTTNESIWKVICLAVYPNMVYSDEIAESLKTLSQEQLVAAHYSGSWKSMYKNRPFIRYNGVYVSTCTYMRYGEYSGWNTPIHMVTYYRYMRFFDDGTCMSLLTTLSPADVIPVFVRKVVGKPSVICTREDGSIIQRPKGIVSGQWALNSVDDGTIQVETPGPVDRYTFHMSLRIRSSGTRRHNKLKWNRFWSVNNNTGAEGDFTLKHDKGYYFVRTKR